MSDFLFITADEVGAQTGGGQVTANELLALREFCGREPLVVRPPAEGTPFDQDHAALEAVRDVRPKLAHVYAGCFSSTVEHLKRHGCLVTYTVAAHGVAESRAAHESVGAPFPYPHLTDPLLFVEYTRGYVAEADLVFCPSELSKRAVESQGRTGAIEVVPHGHSIDYEKVPARKKNARFTAGYLGAVGPDKGLHVLLKAWAMARPHAGGVLTIAGRHGNSAGVIDLARKAGATAVLTPGWVDDLMDFYTSIDVYVQPSMTEGFGMEVLEAMACGTPVLCSSGAGAADLVPASCVFRAGDAGALAALLADAANGRLPDLRWDNMANGLEWPEVRLMYRTAWHDLMCGRTS